MLPPGIVKAIGEDPMFGPGDRVRISSRSPVGHYRVPVYLRGKSGRIESVIEPAGIDNEEEGYGRNAGMRLVEATEETQRRYLVIVAGTADHPGALVQVQVQ